MHQPSGLSLHFLFLRWGLFFCRLKGNYSRWGKKTKLGNGATGGFLVDEYVDGPLAFCGVGGIGVTFGDGGYDNIFTLVRI